MLSSSSYTTACGKHVFIQRKLSLKRLTLRFSQKQQSFVATAPIFVPISKVIDFIDGAHKWFKKVELSQQYQQTDATKVVAPGDSIFVLGNLVRIDHVISPKATVLLKDKVLEVHGISSKFEQTLKTYLKHLAYEKLSYYSHEYAKSLGVKFNKILIKDMTTRFGSCTSRGHLNYCWRIIMAPEPVLAYLCAHEVAHLKEMNHSKKFWVLVEQLCPNYQLFRKWLKQHGKELYAKF